MKLQQLLDLSEVIDGDTFDVYFPKDGVVLMLTDDEPARHLIDSFSIQELGADDCMALVVDVADQVDAFVFNMNDDGELVQEISVEIFRLARA